MLSLYIHIPFCSRKCSYCGFYSTCYREKAADAFLQGIASEAIRLSRERPDLHFDTLYMGGGTPTVLSSEQCARLFSIIHEQMRLLPGAEVTCEANPESASLQKLDLLRSAGVNRLSIGVQSFNDRDLTVLGRPHTGADAVQAFGSARRAGFDNVGVDLIYGIPGQSMHEWKTTLDRTRSLRPEHVSLYGLSLEDGTPLARDAASGRVDLPGDGYFADLYGAACGLLDSEGYEQYEISNFSLPGRRCRHNEQYWNRGEFVGLGPSAWSFLDGRRSANVADADDYLQRLRSGRSPVVFEEHPTRSQAVLESLFLGLRTTSGFDLERHRAEEGSASADALEARIAPLACRGLFFLDKGRLRLTREGMLLSNEAIARILT